MRIRPLRKVRSGLSSGSISTIYIVRFFKTENQYTFWLNVLQFYSYCFIFLLNIDLFTEYCEELPTHVLEPDPKIIPNNGFGSGRNTDPCGSGSSLGVLLQTIYFAKTKWRNTTVQIYFGEISPR
jgi:hypothetical protein